MFYLKSNLLHIAKDHLRSALGVTAGLSATLRDGYRATCPVTCAINFSGKAKLCLFCLYMSYISSSFDTNWTTFTGQLRKNNPFLKSFHVVLSSVPPSPSAVIHHTAVFNILPSVALYILLTVTQHFVLLIHAAIPPLMSASSTESSATQVSLVCLQTNPCCYWTHSHRLEHTRAFYWPPRLCYSKEKGRASFNLTSTSASEQRSRLHPSHVSWTLILPCHNTLGLMP